MNDQTQHILESAESAHQSIELAISLLQESLGNMGEILTQGCEELGIASLGSTMRLGQRLKEAAFLLGDLRGDAHGLCILIGKDLGVPDPECKGMSAESPCSNDAPDYPRERVRGVLGGMGENPGVYVHGLFRHTPEDNEEFPPGEDEYDDDEQPF